MKNMTNLEDMLAAAELFYKKCAIDYMCGVVEEEYDCKFEFDDGTSIYTDIVDGNYELMFDDGFMMHPSKAVLTLPIDKVVSLIKMLERTIKSNNEG